MSVIKRSDLITDEAVRWPDEYAKDLDKIIAKSKQLGSSTSKKNTTELAKVQRQLSVATERSTKEFVQQKAALNTLNTQTRNAVKDVQNLDNAYDRLSKELNDTRKSYKNLTAAGKGNTTQAKAQLAQIKKLDRQLKSIDNTVGQNQRSVGKYSNALKGVTARFIGWAAVATALFAALRSGIRTVLEYSKSNSTLNAILNKSSKETKELRKQQIELGKSTAFTATQVTKAQTELSRLGLSMSQIIDLTPAILDGAVALGVDMADAAELVAGQLNAFNLAATEGGRITDVLVRATQISAFNFERLQTALGVVSPAAQAVGISFERMTAVLSAAVDANIDASTASTALRNIFIELSNQGLTWEQAMTQINTSTDRLSTANELFGKRGAVVATVIANNTDKINENEEALNKAAGSAKKFADEQLDNLSGDLILLTSAWEGFILSIENGEGFISNVFRWAIQALANDFKRLSDFISGTDRPFENWKDKIRKSKPDADLLNFSIDELNKKLERQSVILNQADHDFTGAKEKIIDYKRQIEFLNELLDANAEAERKAAELAKKAAEEKARLAAEAAKKIIDEEKKIQSLLKDLRREGIEGTQTDFIKEVEAKEDHNNTILNIEKKLANDLKAINKGVTDANELAADERIKIAKEEEAEKVRIKKEAEEIKAAIISKSFDLASELGNRFTDFRLQQIEQELTAQEFARDRELEAAGDNERLKFEINKKFDAQRRELQRKQAVTEKANAIFQVALNTAIGITSALKTPVLIPFIIALGALQAAFVAAAPIPQFNEGKEHTPKDYIAGEKRPELRKSKGKWSLVDKPTMFKNSPGDTIVSGKETDSILGTVADLAGNNLLTDQKSILSLMNNDFHQEKRRDENLAYILKRNNEDLIRTIKNKKEVSIKVKNAKVTERSGNQIVHIIDYYYKR